MDSAVRLLAIVARGVVEDDGNWLVWLIIGALVVPAVIAWLVPARVLTQLLIHGRLRKPPEGCCQNCGYDLRATPRRCPECGIVPVRKPRNYVRYRGVVVRCRRPAEAEFD
jgi:hypothetical protein